MDSRSPSREGPPKQLYLKVRQPTDVVVSDFRKSLRKQGLCTRFCAVKSGNPRGWLDAEEPAKVARYAEVPGLKYLVLTSVDRDDLPDLGAGHYAATIRALKATRAALIVEALTPDFQGREACVAAIVDVDVVTLGQYLRPTSWHLPVERYVHPDEFAAWKQAAEEEFGFLHCASGPLVRSSYKAAEHFLTEHAASRMVTA